MRFIRDHHATGPPRQLHRGDNGDIMACRSGFCCGSGPVNEDNARFLLLALFIVIYLLCGAAVFSALEQPKEREAKERWEQRFEHFSQKYNLSKKDLNNFLRNYEEANVAGIRVDTIRPRWDFTGAFYFVGTVVSTIGEMEQQSFINRFECSSLEHPPLNLPLRTPSLIYLCSCLLCVFLCYSFISLIDRLCLHALFSLQTNKLSHKMTMYYSLFMS